VAAWREPRCHTYATFVKATQRCWHTVINLDVISPSTDPETLDRYAGLSAKNLKILRDAGIQAVPVFHQGESYRFLERMLIEGHRLICIAPIKPIDPDGEELNGWLADCFTIAAGVRLHCLGTMSPQLVRRFPWTSTDATTWFQQPRRGQLWIPRYDNERPDFSLPHLNVAVTDQSSRFNGHYDTLKDFERRMVTRWFDDNKVTMAQAKSDYKVRWRLMVRFLMGLQKSSVFGTNTSRQQFETLAQGGVTHVLHSYFDLQRKKPDRVKDFVMQYS
jgi:hypothetical protein